MEYATLLVNLDGGYHFSRKLSATVTVFNLFNRPENDVTYYYASQLKGEAAPINDIHFHPVEPRTARATVTVKF